MAPAQHVHDLRPKGRKSARFDGIGVTMQLPGTYRPLPRPHPSLTASSDVRDTGHDRLRGEPPSPEEDPQHTLVAPLQNPVSSPVTQSPPPGTGHRCRHAAQASGVGISAACRRGDAAMMQVRNRQRACARDYTLRPTRPGWDALAALLCDAAARALFRRRVQRITEAPRLPNRPAEQWQLPLPLRHVGPRPMSGVQ